MADQSPRTIPPKLPPGSAPPAGFAAEHRARAGDWYATYGRAVYSYVRFHLPSADAAEDVTSDTFLKVFRAADQYDPARAQPQTWIFRIAQNTLRDYLRKDRVRRHVPLGSMRDLVSDAPSPEERLLWEERVARLLDAVSALNEGDREIIGLRYGSGMDTAAVAQVLGIRESAVRTRLWRALTRLRRVLDRDEERP
jgi:RNA polymerase sigma-70 factor, ECF subfamily